MKHVHGGDIYRHRGCLDFSSNINPLGTPDSVKKAVMESLDHLAEYPEPGSGSLCKAIAEAEQVPYDSVLCGNGAAELIFSVVNTARPKEALLPAPAFAEYEQALRMNGCLVRHCFLKEENGFAPDLSFCDQITEKTDMVFFCNPNNPTGRSVGKEFLEKLLARCKETGTILFLDECFGDFAEDPDEISCKGALDRFPNLFILKAFTKRYGMAGLRLGYGMCSDYAFLGKVRESIQPWNVSVPAQMAGIAALSETGFAEKARAVIFQERPFLKKTLQEAGFRVFPSDANYLFFKGREDLADRLLEQGILIRDCSNYAGLSRGFFRIAVRTHPENRILAAALKGLP